MKNLYELIEAIAVLAKTGQARALELNLQASYKKLEALHIDANAALNVMGEEAMGAVPTFAPITEHVGEATWTAPGAGTFM